MRQSFFFLGTTLLVATIVVFLFAISSLPSKEPLTAVNTSNTLPPLEKPVVSFGSPIRGQQDAAVTIVVFGDFLCEACATMEEALGTMLNEFKGKVRLVWKDFPNVNLHAEAMNAAMAARCAQEQGAFWQYHDQLFSNQTAIASDIYGDLAAAIKLNRSDFNNCYNSALTKPIVQHDFEEGLRLRIDGTPYLFIGDRRVTSAIDESLLRNYIISALAAPAPVPATEQPAKSIK